MDLKTRTRAGLYGRIKDDPPIILGWDVSGKVVSTAKEATGCTAGNEVFGMINFQGHGKAYDEYVDESSDPGPRPPLKRA